MNRGSKAVPNVGLNFTLEFIERDIYLFLLNTVLQKKKPDTWVEVYSDRIDFRCFFFKSNHYLQDGIEILYDLYFYILIYKEKIKS